MCHHKFRHNERTSINKDDSFHWNIFPLYFFLNCLILHLKLHVWASWCGGLPSSMSGSASTIIFTLWWRPWQGISYSCVCRITWVGFVKLTASSRIQTWDLSLCLYLNLKHDNWDHSTTMVNLLPLIKLTFVVQHNNKKLFFKLISFI